MTLILTAAPKQDRVGMDASAELVIPGKAPPMVSPHCRQCGVPVELFEVDAISSPWFMGMSAQCHGKTEGRKVPHDEAAKSFAAGQVLWFFGA